MKPRRDKHAQSRTAQSAPAADPPTWPQRLQGLMAVLAIGLALTATLVPSEGAIREGTFAVLATCWCLLFVGWTAHALVVPGRLLSIGWTEVVGGCLVAWHTLSALLWLGRGNDRQTLNALWIMVAYGLTLLLLRQVIQSAQRARVVLALFLWLATTLAATGYVQYFVTMPALRVAYQKNPQRVLAEHGLAAEPDSPQRILFENRLRSVEPLATFALTNSLAGFVAPWLIVALALGLAVWSEPTLRRPLAGSMLIAVLLAGCLFLTKSRTAVLALLAGLVLLALYGRRGGWRIGWRLPAMAVGALMVIGLGVVYVGGLDAEVLSEAPKSVLYRLEYWRSTAAMIADAPLFGCGPGNFQESYAAYKLPQASEMVGDPHNFLLEIWATAGTPAILLCVALFAAFAVDLMRIAGRPSEQSAREQPPAATLFYSGGITALVLGFLTAALSDFPLDTFGDLPIPILWWVGGPLLPFVWWLLQPWIQHGELPVGAVVVALLVLFINLLAAGAVTFPGVVVTALVLVPVAMRLVTRPSATQQTLPPPTFASLLSRLPAEIPMSRGLAGGLCAVAFALAILCLWTEYQPVLNSRLQMRIALRHLRQGEAAAAERAAGAAAAADPRSPEPWRMLAELHFQRFMDLPETAAWSDFVLAADELRRRNPEYHAQYFQRGNWHFLAWQQCHRINVPLIDSAARHAAQPARLAEALAAYREAIHRYPNHALYHGQLAWALEASGDHPAASAAAERALALDDAMPHADQKLAGRRIADWQPSPAGSPRHMRPETAEQTIRRLRTSNTRTR